MTHTVTLRDHGQMFLRSAARGLERKAHDALDAHAGEDRDFGGLRIFGSVSQKVWENFAAET